MQKVSSLLIVLPIMHQYVMKPVFHHPDSSEYVELYHTILKALDQFTIGGGGGR